MQLLVNEQPFPFAQSVFPGGEIHIRLGDALPYGQPVVIEAALKSAADIMALLMLTDAVRRAGAGDITLKMSYLPYARQDRICNDGEALAVRVMCELINAQSYAAVEIWDIHSDVGAALINRVRIVPVGDLLERVSLDFSRTVFVAPDAGAMKRVASAARRFGASMVRADKTRDTATGAITGTVVYSDPIGDRDFLIVDDICDGGRTFIELAKVLRPLTDGKIMLYVTHGIFSHGTAVFDGIIDEVFVANSFVADLPPNFKLL